MVPTPSAPTTTTNRAAQKLLHPFTEITWHESIQKRVDSRVKVRDKECKRCEEGGKSAATIVISRPILPHLAGVVWQVAECKGEHDDNQHAYDTTPCSQYILRGRCMVGFCDQRRPTTRWGLAAEYSGTTTSTCTTNSINCDLTVWQWTRLKLYPQRRSITPGTRYKNTWLKPPFFN
jgi:hypothetical protein